MPLPPVFPGDPLVPERLLRRGKVRDIYDAGKDHVLLVASDRVSAFDVVLSPGIPGKGVVLTQLSNFWFASLNEVVRHHIVATDLSDFPKPFCDVPAFAGRSCLVRRLRILPVECVARGYIMGSGWQQYLKTGEVCGVRLPPGLQLADRLPHAIFTPSTKAEVGHDENIPFDQVAHLVGAETADRVRSLTLELYERAAAFSEQRGIILADTKFEFGVGDDGEICWADEALTPDSSRFWPVAEYRAGSSPPSFDKQYVRDWLDTCDWDKKPPAPPLPQKVIEGTLGRYLEAYRRLTGAELAFG